MCKKKILFLVFFILTVVLVIVGCDNDSPIERVTLTMEVTGSGDVLPAVGKTECEKGVTFNITADSAEGWEFVEWIGEVGEVGSAETVVFMDKDKTVQAVFEEEVDLTDIESLVFDTGVLQPEFDPQTSEYTLNVGNEVDSIDITAALADGNSSLTINGDSVENGSSKIITLNDPGQITTVTIEVTAENKDTKTYTIIIERATVSVSNVTITQEDQQLTVGETLQLSAELQPANATNKNISWSSDSEAVATVNSDGLVTGISTADLEADRTAVISVITEDGGFTDSITIEVKTPYITAINPVDGINVEYGTSRNEVLSELANSAPTTSIMDNTDAEHEITLTWTLEESYDRDTAGTYTATGTFSLPAGVVQPEQPMDLEVATAVVVGSPEIYTVTFNKNTGDTEAEPQAMEAVEGQSLDNLPVEPTKALHNFKEWNTKEDGTGDQFTADTIVNNDITVYAQWERIVIENLSIIASGPDPVYSDERIVLETTLNITGTENTPISYSEAVANYNLDSAAATISIHNEDKSEIITIPLNKLTIVGNQIIITLADLIDSDSSLDENYKDENYKKVTVDLVSGGGQWADVTATTDFPQEALDCFTAGMINMLITQYSYLFDWDWDRIEPSTDILGYLQFIIDGFFGNYPGDISIYFVETNNPDIVNESGVVSSDLHVIGETVTIQFGITVGSIEESDNYLTDQITFTVWGIDGDNSSTILANLDTKTSGQAFNIDINVNDIGGTSMPDGDYPVIIESYDRESSLLEEEVFNQSVNFSSGTSNVPVTLNTIGTHYLSVTVDDVEIGSGIEVNVGGDAEVTPIAVEYITGSGSNLEITLTPEGRSLNSINDGTSDLVESEDYTVTNNVYTILSSYLEGKALGELTLTFAMDGGADPVTVIRLLEEISSASVSIEVPSAGNTPEDAAAIEEATSSPDFTVTNVTWNEEMRSDGNFKAGTIYTADLTLTSKNNKQFSTSFTPTVAGSSSISSIVTSGTGEGNTVEFTVIYPATAFFEVSNLLIPLSPKAGEEIGDQVSATITNTGGMSDTQNIKVIVGYWIEDDMTMGSVIFQEEITLGSGEIYELTDKTMTIPSGIGTGSSKIGVFTDNDQEIEACNIKYVYDVNLVANPVEGGTVIDNTNIGLYSRDDVINVTATANSGYSFVNWTVDGTEVSTATTFEYTITADTTLVANFVKDPVDPLESVAWPVVASAVNEGDNLSQSNLNGTFEDPETGVTVAGDLGWEDGSQQVNLSRNYIWIFTPDEQNRYNQITGMVEVEAQDHTKPQIFNAYSGDNGSRVKIDFTEEVILNNVAKIEVVNHMNDQDIYYGDSVASGSEGRRLEIILDRSMTKNYSYTVIVNPGAVSDRAGNDIDTEEKNNMVSIYVQ